jgi:glycosyltransferase involved in cell wall biosynthesis
MHNIICSVGRLSSEKGFDLAARAAAVLKRKGINFFWCIVGEGNERKKLQEIIKNNGLESNFVLLGVIKNSIRWISYLKLLIIAIAASSLAKWLVSFNDFNLIVKMALAGCVFGLIYVVFVIMLLKSVQDMAKRVLIKLIK